MKNKTFLFTILASLILILGFEISAGRIRFGAAYFNDSTSSIMTGNKNTLINGEITARDSIDAGSHLRADDIFLDLVTPSIQWNLYGMNITGGLDQLEYNATAHYFSTETGTTLLGVDSANGVLTYLPGYSGNGRGLLKRAIYSKSYNGFTPGNNIEIAHGIAPLTKIVSWSVKMYDDSTSTWYPTAYVGTTSLTTGTASTIGGTYLTHFVPAASGNWKNSGDTIRWEVLYLGN